MRTFSGSPRCFLLAVAGLWGLSLVGLGLVVGSGGCDPAAPGAVRDASVTTDGATADAETTDAAVSDGAVGPDAGPDAQEPPGIDPDSPGI